MSLLSAAQELIGLDVGGDDFPFFQEAARCHFTFSLLPILPEGLSDLEEWDRNNLFLLELSGKLSGDFQLAEDSQIAFFQPQGDLPKAILNMKGDGPWQLYAMGEPKQGAKLLKSFSNCHLLYPCQLNHSFLLKQAHELSPLEEFHFHRELPPQFPEEGHLLKGQSRGKQAGNFLKILEQEQGDQLNLTLVAGLSRKGSLGHLRYEEKGLLQGQGLRLKEFLQVADRLQEAQVKRLQQRGENLCKWEREADALILKGEPLEFELSQALARPEALLRQLTSGARPLNFLGSYQRLGRDQWKAQFVDLKSSWQMEMEITPHLLRLFPADQGGLAMIEKLEAHFAKQLIGWRLNV